jgi:TonB family protein
MMSNRWTMLLFSGKKALLGALALVALFSAPSAALSAASAQEIEMEGVVHYLFWATGVEFTGCPQDLVSARPDDTRTLCGQATTSSDEFQILLDAAIIKMRREEGPSVTAMSEWSVESGRQTRNFGCCQSTFEIQVLESRSLVLATMNLPASITMPRNPAQPTPAVPRPPATGEVILQPGDLLLGPSSSDDGPGRYGITITGPGEAQRMRMTWEQSKRMNEAYKTGISGVKVFLTVLVAPDGKVASASIASCTAPDLGFEEAALLALGQWSLDTALLDGAAEASSIDAVVEFEIPGSMP